jgi:hypothetical protein
MLQGIFDLFSGLTNHQKKLDLKTLPTQGVFYPNDFFIKIKKAKLEDIIEYEYNFKKDNLYIVVESIKKVVMKNCFLPRNYDFAQIKSVDLVFIFLEIVKFTMKKEIIVEYYDEYSEKNDKIEFNSKNFNYFDFSTYERDEETAEILIDGYRFSMPSVGVENCLTFYILDKMKDKSQDWESKSFDFIFFCGNKGHLTTEEMDNLVIIFNEDLDSKEQKKVEDIIEIFMKIVGYTLIIDGRQVEIKSKIDLENVWK